MAPQLQTYADHFRQSQRDAHRIADDLTRVQFNWKPSEKAWSVGECFVHLNVIAKAYLPVLEAAAASGTPRGHGPYTYGFVSRLFTNAVRPGGRPIPTGGPMNPSSGGPQSDFDHGRALASMDEYTDRYVHVCERLDGLDYSSIKVSSPFLPLLRLPIGAFTDAMGLHAIRHVQQAERVTQHPSFPDS
ncbi:MAG: DinB family protein [Bacteroidota bacterium]